MQEDHYNLETRVLGQAPAQRTAATPLRILAFTCTRDRPFFTRCCVLQMQQQTYPVDHVIYINHPEARNRSDLYNYISLLEDIVPQHGTITIRYGRSGTQQFNHLQALALAAHDDYDLYLKIDDDDVYRRNYVRSAAADLQKNGWDFSGSHAQGLIDGPKWGRNNCVSQLGMEPEDIRLGVIEMMPSSYAFSRKAIDVIRRIPADIDMNEDILWRRKLTVDTGIKVHLRQHSGMAYHLHGRNVSTWDSYESIL